MRAEPLFTTALAVAAVLTSGALPFADPDPSAVPASSAWVLDDFERGDLVAGNGASWIGISDALAGGTSRLRLSSRGAGNGSRHALRVEGRLSGEKGVAGAWVAIDGLGRAVDLSDFTAIRLRVKGAGGVRVGLRSGRVPSTNFMARAETGSGWSTVEVPFSSLRPAGGPATELDPANVWFLGVQPAGGEAFDFEVDDVALVATAGSSAAAPKGTGNAMMVRAPRTDPADVACSGWTELATDPIGDGRATLADAVGLDVCGGSSLLQRETLWFRVRLARPAPADSIGANLVFELDGQPDNGSAWWGASREFRFDRLATTWVFHVGRIDQGVLGTADADAAGRGELIDPTQPSPRLAVSKERTAVFVGVPRRTLGPDLKKVRLVAAVGSALVHSDDVPGGSGTSLAGAVP